MSKARDIASAAPAPAGVTTTELGYVDGVTSAIQTQLGTKQAIVSGVDDTEIGYLNGVTSAIQTQIDSKIGQSTAINPTIVDAKGDIIAATAADTVARLAVGANNTVLTADSATSTGLKWSAPSAPAISYTAINPGGTALSGSGTVTISGLSGYNDIFILVGQASSASAASGLEIGFNSNGTSNCRTLGIGHGPSATTHSMFISNSPQLRYRLSLMGSSVSDWFTGGLQIMGCNSTNNKPVIAIGSATGTGAEGDTRLGVYEQAAVISSVNIVSTIGNFDAGTVYVYGA
jgi:hypothetical protein